MSEGNGFATRESLVQWSARRRYKPFEWPGVGVVTLQSPTAGEFIKIDSARQRGLTAAMSGNAREHERATQDLLLQVCYLLVLDHEHTPFFSTADREFILSLDAAITEPLTAEALAHCGLDEADIAAAQKK